MAEVISQAIHPGQAPRGSIIRFLQEPAPLAGGRERFAIFESGDFDLLFPDIFTPGMDGFETTRLIHRQQPRTPIIVISGNSIYSGSGADFLTMATKLGAVSGLQKPFKPAALLAAVAGCLEAAKSPSSSSVIAGDVAPGP